MKHKRPPELQERIDQYIVENEFMTSKIRATCRAGFELSTDHLISIARGEGENTTPFASVRAAALLAQVSMGKQPKNMFIENNAWLCTMFNLALKHFKDPKDYEAWTAEVVANLENMQ